MEHSALGFAYQFKSYKTKMAETKFYLSDIDRGDLFNYIYSKGGKLIPDINFKTENYIEICSFDEFLYLQIHETTHFFLVHNSFAIEPLLVTQNRYLS